MVFMRRLGSNDIVVKGRHKVMLVHNPEELAQIMKAYINFEKKDRVARIIKFSQKSLTDSIINKISY